MKQKTSVLWKSFSEEKQGENGTMIKGNKVFDLITGDYTGRWPQEYKPSESSDGKKPIIRPSGFNSAQVFPFPLKTEKHVKQVTTFNGSTVHVLIPDGDIYNFTEKQLSNTVFRQLTGEREEVLSEKDRRIEELKDEKAELQAELNRLKDEDIEQDKYSGTGGSGGSRLSCPNCGRVNTESEWDQNGGMCPWCEQVPVQEAQRV